MFNLKKIEHNHILYIKHVLSSNYCYANNEYAGIFDLDIFKFQNPIKMFWQKAHLFKLFYPDESREYMVLDRIAQIKIMTEEVNTIIEEAKNE